MNAGKIADARALFRIAAEANDSTAAFVLATTYDPIMLEKLKGHDSEPNVAIARAWYQRAADLGSTEASDWLKTAGNR
jgi:TPR repeat protein